MKLFKLSIKDLKEFIIQKKMIFIILFFSIIVSSYGFFFFSSLNMNSAQVMNTYTGESSCFFVSGEDITYQKINELLRKIQNIKSNISYRVYSNVEYGKKIKNIKSGEEKQLYNLIIGTNKIIIDSNDFIGREITEEDRKNCTNYIMIDSLSEIATSDMLIYNKTININGKEYKVMAIDLLNIRINKYINYISDNKKIDNINDIEIGIIPDTTFFKNEYPIKGIEIITDYNTTVDENNRIKALIQQEFYDNNMILPTKIKNSLENINYYTILYTVVMMIALVNILALFRYWVDQNWRKYMIYRLNGATNRTIYNLIMLECFIISSVAFIISLIIYFSTILLLRALEINYILKMNEIIILYLIIILIVSFNVHVIAKKISKTEVRYLGRK